MINFKAPYNKEEAVSFLGQFLPDDFQKANEEIKVDFKPQFIRNIRKIGEVSSLENLHIYEIIHESENDPRVSLSKDSFRLLAHFNVRKALIFFVSQNSPNYRLSLVTVDLKWESGAKVKREYSNPRRYSFFLGPDARVHTPHDFLVKKGQAKNTTDLLSRFDVEIVTKEFFTKYKGLFGDVSGYLEKDHGFKIFAEKNDIDIDTFSKKLLGQIVFCYFLQRKGWLGAKRGEPINKGDKDFMRSLFNRGIAEKKNFYNDYLEYLFYDSLNNRAEGSSDFYRKHFDCQIPFLNGGLFEPPEDYDWEKSFVHIPDKLFSNKDNTGILDVFDLYNFTVYEDDPIDREVSVDPEMLGKVFENLLPENLRKGQGAYYTPREIVHYMCQESLINYLTTETKVDTDKIKDLVVNKHFEGGGNKESIDKALKNIKVCDPACGSGAFLVGMLHEIVSARRILNPKADEYHFKKEAIQNCIYGVDIDPGAVEIAKLRLWLSLVVDYELKDIEPLPNLDYKIMCGNSLLEEFEEVRFYDGGADEASLFKDDRKQKIQELREKVKEYFKVYDDKQKRKKRDEINKLKDWFIKATLEKRRKEITRERKKIEAKADMFNAKNRGEYFTAQGEIFVSEAKINEVLRELHNPQKPRPFFIWKLEFMDVFEDKGGFDVVIANPPYVGEKGHKEMFREIKKGGLGNFYLGKMDLFYFFFHLALNLGKQKSDIAFITTDYYPTAMGAKKLRQDFKERTVIKNLMNFNELKIFESALGQHNMITILQKNQAEAAIAQTCITQTQGFATPEVLQSILNGRDTETHYYRISQKDLYDGDEYYIRITGNSKISDNPIQRILDKIKAEGVSLGTICNVNQGIVSAADKVSKKHVDKYRIEAEVGDGIFVLSDKEISSLNLSKKDKEILKPWFKNSDIFRWGTSLSTTEKLIYADKRLRNLENNKLKEYLFKFKKILDDSTVNSPYLHRPRDIKFDSEKIIAPQRSPKNTFGYNEKPWYASADVYYITSRDNSIPLKYILALLNSRIYYSWLYYRGKRKGELLELYQIPLAEIPIKKAQPLLEKDIVEVVNKILLISEDKDYFEDQNKQTKVKEYERQIDQMVYKLYGLTQEEINIVENFNK
jgi:adenine-specific DNA-methyltransferase